MARRQLTTDVVSRYSGLRPVVVSGDRGERAELPPRDMPDAQAPEGFRDAVEPYTVVEGDRIDVLAYDHLGDSRLWPAIADLNPDVDPLVLVAGQRIFLPRRSR